MPFISVVTPVYNAVGIVDELYRQLVENLSKISDDFEIIMVNDACPHGSSIEIARLAQVDSRVKLIDFVRNFGQHTAISAGLDYAKGDYVIVMDCDLQDPPSKIQNLYDELIRSGKEACFAVRENRKDGSLKKFYSKVFRGGMQVLTDRIFLEDKDIANFSIISKKVVLSVRKLRETNRNYGSLVKWCGFDFAYVEIEMQERYSGKSAYTFMKSLKHALNILLQQSAKPLYVSVFFSFSSFIVSCCFAWIILYNYLIGIKTTDGWASTMLAISLVSTCLFFNLAIMSVYIANIFKEQQGRPLYVINRMINIEED